MRSIFAAVLVFAFANPVYAGTMEVRPDAPVASFTFPDDWKTTRVERGVQAKTDDEEVYIWVETYKPNELETVVAEHNAYWKREGVQITGRELNQRVENGVTVQVVSEKATYEGKPTVLYYLEYDLGLSSKSNILITYWASPEGDTEYADDVQSIIGSMVVTETGKQASQ
jgi:hypothetical protein